MGTKVFFYAMSARLLILAKRGNPRDAKLQGLNRCSGDRPASRKISKPLEITGRKAMGAKVLRRYASPAAGYFASETYRKERKIYLKEIKTMSRRIFALFLSLVMCLSLVNISVFAVESEAGYDLNIPLNVADPENGIQYPIEYPGFGSFLMEEYPKDPVALSASGTWCAQGTWEDGTQVMTIEENGNAVFYEPAGDAAMVEVSFTYEAHPVSAAPAEDAAVFLPETMEAADLNVEEEPNADAALSSADTVPASEVTDTEIPDAGIPQEPSAEMSDAPMPESENNEAAQPPAVVETVTVTWKILVTGDAAPVAEAYIKCDETDISAWTYFERKDGAHTIELVGGYEWKGRLVFGGPHTVTIKGDGTINADGKGSAIVVKDGATVILEGNVTVTGGTGTAHKSFGKVGGGIYVAPDSNLVMRGGFVTGNQAEAGGGIFIDNVYRDADNALHPASFEMTGGSVTENTAIAHEGGGIFCYGNGVIDPQNGNITVSGNETKTTTDLGGGGVYVNSSGKMSIINAVVTGNIAQGLGGGIGGCLHGVVSNLSPDTAAIYSNTATNTAGGGDGLSNKKVDHDGLTWTNGIKTNGADYFVSGYSVIGSRSLNGGIASWQGSAVIKEAANSNVFTGDVSTTETDPLIVRGLLSLKVTNPDEVKAKADTLQGYKVVISGNTSGMHGGGIGVNGILTFGEYSEKFTYSDTKIDLNAAKTVSGGRNEADSSKAGYTFQLLKESTVIATAVSDSAGNIRFTDILTSVLFGEDKNTGDVSATLTLREVKGDKPGMCYDETDRTIVLHATRSSTQKTITTSGNSTKVTVYTYSDTLKSATVSINGKEIADAADVSGSAITLSGSANFTNKMEYGSLTVTKAVTGPAEAGEQFTFTVVLGSSSEPKTSKDADQYNGNGTYTFQLRAGETAVINNIPKGISYSVSEATPSGYTAKWSGDSPSGTIDTAGRTFAVTCTNERSTTDLTVKKVVAPVDSTSQSAPSASFKIVATLGDGSGTPVEVPNGTETAVYTPNGVYTFYLKNGESVGITGIPTDAVTYTVTEPDDLGEGWTKGSIENAQGTASGQTVTVNNSYYKVQESEVKVTKSWHGTGSVMPDSVTVQLYRNGEPYGAAEQLTENGSWSHSWGKLPAYDSERAPYTYAVKEVSVNYSTGIHAAKMENNDNVFVVTAASGAVLGGWGVTENGMVLENTWLPAVNEGSTGFTLTKVDSRSNELKLSGAEFTLTDGNVTKTFTTADDGSVTITGLTPGVWTMTESKAPDNYKPSTGKWTITVSKTFGNTTFTGSGLQTSWVNHWDCATDVANQSLTVTNEVNRGHISLTKALELDVRPDDHRFDGKVFTFAVYAGTDTTADAVATLRVKADGSTVSTGALPRGVYTIVETERETLEDYAFERVIFSDDDYDAEVPGFQVFVEGASDDSQIVAVMAVNHYKRHVGDLRLSKLVSGNAGQNDRDWHFLLTLKAPAAYVPLSDDYDAEVTMPVQTVNNETGETTEEEVIIPIDLEKYVPEVGEGEELPTPEESTITFQLTLKHRQSVLIKGLPVGTTYIVTEVEANQEDYATTAKNNEGIIDDEAVSAVEFENSRSYYAPATTNITVRKNWVGDDPANRPTSITLQLLEDGAVYSSVTLNADTGWAYTWHNLDAGGNWTVSEAEVPAGYISSVMREGNTFTVTNSYGDTPENPDIPDPDVPLADLPTEDLFDEEVPLADLPMTGDTLFLWFAALSISGAGLMILAVSGKRRKRDKET